MTTTNEGLRRSALVALLGAAAIATSACSALRPMPPDARAARDVAELRAYAGEQHARIEGLEADLERSEAARAAEREHAAREIERLRHDLRQARDLLESEIRARERQISSATARAASLQGRVAEREEHERRLGRALRDMEATLAGTRAELETTSTRLETSREEVGELHATVEATREGFAVERDLFERRAGDLEQLKIELSTALEHIQSLEDTLALRDETIAALERKIAGQSEASRELEEHTERIRAQQMTAEASFEDAERRRQEAARAADEARRERNRLVTELKTVRDELEKTKARLRELERGSP